MMCLNAIDYDFNFPVSAKKIVNPTKFLSELAGILKALSNSSPDSLPGDLNALISDIKPDETHNTIASQLKDADESTVLLGLDAFGHSQFSNIRALAGQIAKLTNSKLGYLPAGGNAAGAWLAGAVPHRDVSGDNATIKQGLDLSAMLKEKLSAYVLLGVEPEMDCAESKQALEAMEQAQFVVSLNSFISDSVKVYADVILPISPFTETSGTFVNAEGRWQSFEGVVEPRGEARPAWKILRVLGNLFGFDDFEFVSSQEVRDELRSMIGEKTPDNKLAWKCPESLGGETQGIETIADHPMYASDCLLRRAESLQIVGETYHSAIRINQTEASKIGVKDGEPATARKDDFEITLPVIIDDRVPDEGILLPSDLSDAVIYESGSTGITLTRIIPTLTNEVVQ
jgi:NADH-quinone oxidoreductase subunit G